MVFHVTIWFYMYCSLYISNVSILALYTENRKTALILTTEKLG